jgi:hypothetical protein
MFQSSKCQTIIKEIHLLEQVTKKLPTTLSSKRKENKHIVFSHVVEAMNNNNKIMVKAMD